MGKSLGNVTENRRQIVAGLIRAGKIRSQADLVRELKLRGLEVTQATASRDLQELGAMRTKGASGEMRYILDFESDRSSNRNLVLSIASSGNTVVLRTPPAAAQLLASALDARIASGELAQAIGTIAGDDTVLVIASTGSGGGALSKRIAHVFGKDK